MNKTLHLTLLGSPRLMLNNQPLNGLVTQKAQALLFYLVVTGRPHSRDQLATLLWGEMTDTQAKNNLRSVLPKLRRLLEDHLQIDNPIVAFRRNSSYWLDVEVLRNGLTHKRESLNLPEDLITQRAALDLYQGEFLAGFHVQNAPAFDAWVLEQREQLHALVVESSSALTQEYIQRANYPSALAANRRLLLLEPWSEPVHRQQMFLLAQMGNRAAALAQYESCQRILAAEFGVAPLAETTALYERIRLGQMVGEVSPPEADTSSPKLQVTIQPSLPNERAEPTAESQHLLDSAVPIPVDGYSLPQRIKLYGRQPELERVQKWLTDDGCRLVGIFGIGGQGKSALAATLVRSMAEPTTKFNPQVRFQRIIWHSLLNAPPLAEVMQQWFYLLSKQSVTSLPASLDQQFAQLLAYLREQRCLLVLDNLESILDGAGRSGYYRQGYEDYGQLLHHIVENEHRSCLLLTSRELPHNLLRFQEDTPAVGFLPLAGVPTEAGRQMIKARGIVGNAVALSSLIQHYSGNPLALKLMAETVHDLFDGNIDAFLQNEALVFDDIRDVLDQQFARLTPLERELMIWLGIVREPVAYSVLCDLLAQPPQPRLLLEAMRSLQRRSLVEKYEEGFALQNVVLEYTSGLLIENIGHELEAITELKAGTELKTVAELKTIAALEVVNGDYSAIKTPYPHFDYLNRFALTLASAKEYVRASQKRRLLQPVADQLVAQMGMRRAELQLQRVLAHLHSAPARGYAAANLLHLLLHLGVNLRGYDFSQLYLRQLYLRGISLPQTNFAQAEIVDSVFSEPFGLVYSAVFSPNGQYLAAGTSEGAIYLWRTADQQLVQVLQAHTQSIMHLAFAQRTTDAGKSQLLLASASDDKKVGCWWLDEQEQMRGNVQLLQEQQESVLAVNLRPDGQRVTSIDSEGHVCLWDVSEQKEIRLIQDFVTIFTSLGLTGFSGDSQTIAVGHRDGTVQLWKVATGEAGLLLTVPTGAISSLALSPDGQTLVTGGKEGDLCLWTLPSGQLQQVIESTTGKVDALAFSPDGKTLASTHGDFGVRLWVLHAQERLQLRHTLLGHTQIVWSVAFGPLPIVNPASNATNHPREARQLLVSSSSDQTVRVWDVNTGQALYSLTGQPRALAAHDISRYVPMQPETSPISQQKSEQPTPGQPKPDWLLAAAGYDQRVHIWLGQSTNTTNLYRILRGADGPLFTVAISPDGRCVASSGNDRSIYLWDIASGQLRQTFQGHTNTIYAIAFQPNGKLLASCSTDGTVRIWDLSELCGDKWERVKSMGTNPPHVVLQTTQHYLYHIAFSPDGHILASAGADLVLSLWDMTQSHYPELTELRKTVRDESEQNIHSIAFSPDGTKVACSGDHLIHVWDLQCSEALLTLRHHTNWIFSLAFSPDGITLASSGADFTVCLWDVATGALRHVLNGHTEAIYKVTFIPDGTTLISSCFDGTLKFWDAQTGECVNTLRVEGPYAGMNITGVTGISEAQKAALRALGAVENV